jgi:DNA-binding NarL/FixJ family response regulator
MPVLGVKRMVQVRRHNSLQHEAETGRGSAVKLVIPVEDDRRRFSILLVGANPLYQKALKLILNDQLHSKGEASFFLHGCSTVEDFEANLSELSEPQRQSVITLLLDEGGEPASTIKNINALKKANPLSRIILISNSKNVDYINRCIEKGIHAYVQLDLSEDLLFNCVCLVAHGQMVFPSHIYRHEFDTGSRSTVNDNAPLSGTDGKEALILGCLASGMPNKEISRLTGLSDPATKMAVSKLLSKIGAKNRVQAAVWAEKNGYALDV